MNTSAPLTLDGTELGAPRRRPPHSRSKNRQPPPPRGPVPAQLARQVAPPSPSGLWALLALLVLPLLLLGYVRAVNRRDWEQQ